MPIANLKSDFTLKILKFRYKKTYGKISSENFEYSLTNSLLGNTRHSREQRIIIFNAP